MVDDRRSVWPAAALLDGHEDGDQHCNNDLLFSFCRRLAVFRCLTNNALRHVCATAKYERREAGELLFRSGQVDVCWYVLLSGSVFMNGRVHLPVDCLGTPSDELTNRQKFDCIVLEPSEMISMDYGDFERLAAAGGGGTTTGPPSAEKQQASAPFCASFRRACSVSVGGGGGEGCGSRKCCSSSSTMPRRCHSYRTAAGGGGGDRRASSSRRTSAVVFDEDLLADLPEVSVDSDDDDEEEEGDFEEDDDEDDDLEDDEDEDSCPCKELFSELRDLVRECLEKEPLVRGDDDVAVLLDFMQHMPAFAGLPNSVKSELCRRMVFAVVDKAGTLVMKHAEQLDSWSVIINGEVEVITSNGGRRLYRLGDSFGVTASTEAQFHQGDMRTLVDDCQFVLVSQDDYARIMSKVSDNYLRQLDPRTGRLVCEKELRPVAADREVFVLTKATPAKLIEALLDESADQHYVEDFLLMYRTFLDSPVDLLHSMLHWFNDSALKERVARLVLLWVNNHFNDFESSSRMMQLLERFEAALEEEAMFNHQRLLNIACSVKSRVRTVTYSRSNRDDMLHFSIVGGDNRHLGIFVAKVEPGSAAERVGLKRGDQLLEVNGHNFRRLRRQNALHVLRAGTHLSMTVKSNLLGFKEMLAHHDGQMALTAGRRKAVSANPAGALLDVVQIPLCKSASGDSVVGQQTKETTGRLGKLIKRLRQAGGGPNHQPVVVDHQSDDHTDAAGGGLLKHSRSNPDLTASLRTASQLTVGHISHYYQPIKPQHPEHILKVYRWDQTFKYLSVYRETTAQNVVQLALQEFGMTEPSSSSLHWSLCEVTAVSGPPALTKQRRLPDDMQNLAERISLNSRYYLKSNDCSTPLLQDDQAAELLREADVCLAQLQAATLAAQLTLQDFSVFASIEPTEYVDSLFGAKGTGWPRLAAFEALVNRETWWVATELCRERSAVRRAKMVKKLVKVARLCREFNNFNSMFAIVCGLEKPCVRRLHQTWDRVPSKYRKVLAELQLLMDPSRNMSKYRQHLAEAATDPPAIPLFPVLKKDLTFMHECNSTFCADDDELVNFDKLRMLAKEVRLVGRLASAPYELSTMCERTGDALLHMNSFEGGSTVATIKRQLLSRPPLPRKKLYEQALMVRRVKAYLAQLQVIDDEAELDRLSCQIEPPPTLANGLAAAGSRRCHQPPPPQRQQSPSSYNSSSRSSSTADLAAAVKRLSGPKFGMDSPHAVQKLLSLADHSRLRPPPPRPTSNGSHLQQAAPTSPADSPPLPCPRGKLLAAANGGRPMPSRMNSSASSTDSVISQQSTEVALPAPALPAPPPSLLLSMPHAVSCDSTDSGHASLDTASTNNLAASGLLPSQRQSYPPRPVNTSVVSLSPSFDHYFAAAAASNSSSSAGGQSGVVRPASTSVVVVVDNRRSAAAAGIQPSQVSRV